MSRAESRRARATLLVVVGAQRLDHGVLCAAGKRWHGDTLGSRPLRADGGVPTLEDVETALQALPPAPGAARMRVLVADTWLAAATLPWSAGMRRTEVALTLARAQLLQAGCPVGAGDTIRLDDAPYGVPRLAVAYPAALVDAVSQAAGRLGVRVDSILPVTMAGWALARRAHKGRLAALALHDSGWTALAHDAAGGRGGLQELLVRAASAQEGQDTHPVQALWRPLCLREPYLAALAEVPLLDLSCDDPARQAGKPFAPLAPFTRVAEGGARNPLLLAAGVLRLRSALDACSGLPQSSAPQWAVLAMTALLAGAAWWQAAETGRRAAAAEAARVVTYVVKPPRPASDWSRADLARIAAVNAAIRELNLPVAAILRALEPPADLQVAVLGVETLAHASGGRESRVKIVAEARGPAEMARYLAFVSRSKPLNRAYLLQHEVGEASAGKPYRFTLEASWND